MAKTGSESFGQVEAMLELAEATRRVAAQRNGVAALIDVQLDIWYAYQLDNPEFCAKVEGDFYG